MSFNFGGNAGSSNNKAFSFGNTSTPVANAPTNLFGGQSSTTPAGPPPASGSSGFSFGSKPATGPNLFGGAPSTENKPMFGATATTETPKQAGGFTFGNTNATSTPAAPAATGGFSFGNTTPAQTPQTNSTNTFSFGNKAETPAAASTPVGGLFGSKPAEEQSKAPQTAGGFSFGGSNTAPTQAANTPNPTGPAGGFSFGAPKDNSQASTAGGSGGFSFGAKKPDTTSASTTTTETSKEAAKPAGGFNFGTSKPEDKKDTATTPAAGGFSFGATKPAENKEVTSAATPSGGFSFGTVKPDEKKKEESSASTPSGGFSFGASKPAENKEGAPASTSSGGFSFGTVKADDKKDATSTAANTSTTTTAPTTANSASSATTGPNAPPPPSLKNKTMEDLISKWSADLDKYSQDFQKQAQQISVWDQSLLSSGDQISRLYSATIESEQHSGKVDQALNYIENQQDELSQLLDSYESQVRDITTEVGVTQPADQERDKAYSQAEKLVGELDGMGKNLADMIAELNKSGEVMSRLKEDDPLTSVVKILNNQLQSLNWIDENAKLLDSKVQELGQLQKTESPRTPATKFRFGSLRLD